MVSDFFFGFNDNFNGEIIKNKFFSIKCARSMLQWFS